MKPKQGIKKSSHISMHRLDRPESLRSINHDDDFIYYGKLQARDAQRKTIEMILQRSRFADDEFIVVVFSVLLQNA